MKCYWYEFVRRIRFFVKRVLRPTSKRHFDVGYDCGWISPRGDFYKAELCKHSDVADGLHVEGAYGLEKAGWVHVPYQGDGFTRPEKWDGNRLTPEQARALRRIGFTAKEVRITSYDE